MTRITATTMIAKRPGIMFMVIMVVEALWSGDNDDGWTRLSIATEKGHMLLLPAEIILLLVLGPVVVLLRLSTQNPILLRA